MSDINPKNYDGANVVIVGRAGGAVEVKKFQKGSQAQLSIAVGTGYKNKTTEEWVDTGTNWYTLTATEDWARQNWPEVESGDQVRVDDARLEFKPYLKKDGGAAVEAKLTYGTLVVVKAKSASSGGGRAAASDAGSGDNTPF